MLYAWEMGDCEQWASEEHRELKLPRRIRNVQSIPASNLSKGKKNLTIAPADEWNEIRKLHFGFTV